ncbi:MAG TPA: 4Fe-4S dicluster domain-containing protein [Bacillota bacterium]|nr:4Fe-4S dicluster domain-containing protein [Bacillota bacterium]
MDLIHCIYQAGLIGEGGAGFPTFVKLGAQADNLLVNAAECEPLLFTDQYIMEHYAHDIVRALELCRKQVQAKRTVIAIKHKYEKQIAALKEAIAHYEAPIELHEMESFYPAGDEQSIIYDVIRDPLPPASLPKDKSTLVLNVGTLRDIWRSTQGLPFTRKIVTVNGDIRKPSLLEVPIGTSVAQCIAWCGGTDLDRYVVILGGPMMGRMIDQDEIGSEVITKTVGGLLVLPYDHPLAVRRRKPIERIRSEARAACIQCNFCTELCPRYLKGHPLHPHEVMRAFALNDPDHPLLAQASLCCECGICELYSCPMGLSPRRVNAYLRIELRRRRVKMPAFQSEGVHSEEDVRRIPTDRMVMKTDLTKWYVRHDFPFESHEADEVRIPLRQGVGGAATAVVKVGDKVEENDLIADLPETSLGARMHASISGTVLSVDESSITISKKG